MVSAYEIDPKTLSWVKDEVKKTVQDAQNVLSAYVEDHQQISQLALFVDYLHRINGVIKIIEIFGAGLLASEMENVASGLMAGAIELQQEAIEVLMDALLQLPSYLEHLYYGHKDIPLVLLPVLNDLRAVQNKELLTESAFFSPNLNEYQMSLAEDAAPATWDVGTIAKKLRPVYLSGLLGVFQGNDVKTNLKKLATVIVNLEQASTKKQTEQIWRISGGLVYALYDNGLEASVAVKLLFGKVDRQIKKLIDEGEAALCADPPIDLLKNLLYYIGRSTSDAKRVVELKESFHLDDILPDEKRINKERGNLIAFNADILDNFSDQIKEELLKIKDALDIAMYTKGGDVNELNPVIRRLKTVSEALGMMGLTKLCKIAQQQQQFCEKLFASGESLKDEDVLHIAGALLFVEASLHDIAMLAHEEEQGNFESESVTTLPEAEYQKLVKLVVQDAIDELNKVKDALVQFSIEMEDHELLSGIPYYINLINGAMEMVCYDRVARVFKETGRYIEQELISKKLSPEEEKLDLLANAISGAEYFLESVLERAVAPETALAMAEGSLAKLGYAPRKLTTEQIIQTKETGYWESSTEPESASIVSMTPSVYEGEPDELVDSELVKIFLSEAGDELDNINANLEKWKVDKQNQHSLNTLIRSFHTLKGAGRIVGATTVGVLAWSIEELLRRVQDGRVQPSNEIVELLEQTVPTLTQLISQLHNGEMETTPTNVQTLIDMARDLRQPQQAIGRT